jgi:DMSO/TMAO reductase YedYZ molybdopterin-dependent catalytic subunit
MLVVEGEVARPTTFRFDDLAVLPEQIADVAALVPGRRGGAVAFRSVLSQVEVSPSAKRVVLESADGAFSQEAPLAALDSAVLVYRLGDAPLPAADGGPVRFLIPNLEECGIGGVDRCTNVKGLGRVRIAR